MSVVQGEAYSPNVPLLLERNRSGTVHSLFRNGINIRVGQRLVFIGTDVSGQLPFAVHIDRRSVDRIAYRLHPSGPVLLEYRQQELRLITCNVTIRLDSARTFSNTLRDFRGGAGDISANFRNFAALLRTYSHKSGFGLSPTQLMSILQNGTDRTELGQTFIRFRGSWDCPDPRRRWQTIRPLIGYGAGLTPAGDDFFIGALAAGLYSGRVSPVVLRELAERFAEHPGLTTDISSEYLHYALKRQFGTSVLQLLDALFNGQNADLAKAFSILAGSGHSSGIDTALGIYCVIHNLLEEAAPS
ncbi:hypothetical protein PAE9249_01583 [Paenibacillus sp. CECT 9249]|uniref:DUF2877 domain-containing protein n=1 Tax=Paenibacillus sp. CECT 9249 TaxID=2845385 RepID=UPI001E6094D4|nr:DUF2877 domain-containing protein [Paenibacillus sp. CECT 9249]CAH0119086.1 hypothetical protein PAE9249_01583 [Paenibacillus sp. CECT 9249]